MKRSGTVLAGAGSLVALLALAGAPGMAAGAGAAVGPNTVFIVSSQPSVVEGNTSDTPVKLNIRRSGDVSGTVTVSMRLVAGTATAGVDYTGATTRSYTLGPGQTVRTITPVTVVGDRAIEPDETFSVQLFNPVGSGTTLGTQHTAPETIVDDDRPVYSVSDVTVDEGDPAVFTVTRSVNTTVASSVGYSTAHVTTSSTPGVGDFAPVYGTLSFAVGQSTKTVTVQTNQDTYDEPGETFRLNLASTGGDPQGVGTILDDDPPPGANTVYLSGPGEALEGDSDSTAVPFRISRSGDTDGSVQVSFRVIPGSATPTAPGADYVDHARTLTLAPGRQYATILPADILGDDAVEADEDLTVEIYDVVGVGTTLGNAQQRMVILNDDGNTYSYSVADATVPEGETAVFTVTRNGSGFSSTVNYTIRHGPLGHGSADGGDVTPSDGVLEFAADETSKTVLVATEEDVYDEPTETFLLTLDSPLGDPQALGSITDDDPPPGPNTISISSPHGGPVVEGDDACCGSVVLSIRRAGDTTGSATVSLRTVAGTATTGVDFVNVNRTFTFRPGQVLRAIGVRIVGDTTHESDETFYGELYDPVGVGTSLGTADVLVTIADDD